MNRKVIAILGVSVCAIGAFLLSNLFEERNDLDSERVALVESLISSQKEKSVSAREVSSAIDSLDLIPSPQTEGTAIELTSDPSRVIANTGEPVGFDEEAIDAEWASPMEYEIQNFFYTEVLPNNPGSVLAENICKTTQCKISYTLPITATQEVTEKILRALSKIGQPDLKTMKMTPEGIQAEIIIDR